MDLQQTMTTLQKQQKLTTGVLMQVQKSLQDDQHTKARTLDVVQKLLREVGAMVCFFYTVLKS